MRGNVISQQTFDQRTQAKRVAEASVAAQEAAVRQAELDFEFTELRAPVSGPHRRPARVAGNLVTGGTTGTTTLLATIHRPIPIRFEFTLDEASYLRYLRAARTVRTSPAAATSLPVKLKLIDETDFAHEGRMDFVDNAIDRSSGTIRGRAEFANPDGTFTPGMFGRIQVAAGAAGRGAARARCGHRHRAGAQVRARRRQRQRRAHQIRHARAASSTACA